MHRSIVVLTMDLNHSGNTDGDIVQSWTQAQERTTFQLLQTQGYCVEVKLWIYLFQ